MKIECIHGYFKFEETSPGQLSKFMSRFGFEIERVGDHFTFSDLIEAPDYSIAGGTFLAAPTLETFEGKPWDVMRENRLVYDFSLGIVVPIDLVTQTAKISTAGNVFVANGMLLPGSLTVEGERVTDYAAYFMEDSLRFKYSEITYE